MKAIVFTALGDLRRRVGQTAALTCALLLSSLALFTAAALLQSLDAPLDDACDRLNTSALQLFLDGHSDDVPAMQAWLQQHEAVAAVGPPIPIYQTSSDLVHNEEAFSRALMLAENLPRKGLDAVQIVTRLGDPTAAAPGLDEVWISHQLATSRGIQLGDTITVPREGGPWPLRVSATVVDPYFSTDNISPTRAWVAPGALAHALPLADLNEVFLGVSLHQRADAGQVRDDLEQAFGGGLSGFALTHEIAKMAHGMFFRIMAVALGVAALLTLLVSILIVAGAVGSAVFADYRLIGTFKAMGYTPAMVNRIYLLRFTIPALIAVPLGLLLGWLVSAQLLALLVGSLGVTDPQWSPLLPALAAGAGVLTTVAAAAWWSARKAGRVEAMPAIRFGAPPPRAGSHRRSVPLGRLPLPAFLGARGLALNPVRAGFAVIGMGVAVAVLVCAVNLTATFERLGENRPMWGMAASDLTVFVGGARFSVRSEHFAARLRQDARVADFVTSGTVQGEIEGVKGIAGARTGGRVFDGAPETVGLTVLEGRHPEGAGEIALAINSALKGGYALGEPVPLFIEGQHLKPKLVGIYQTGQNLGLGFRLHAATMNAVLPMWQARTFEIKTAAGVDPAAFKDDLIRTYGEAVDVGLASDLTEQLAGLVTGIRGTLMLLSALLLAICLISIYNDTLLCLREQQQTLGILKAAGMTPGRLRLVLVWRTQVVTLVSLVLFLPMVLVALPLLLNQIAAGIGLVSFPLVIDPLGTVLIVPGLLAFAFAAAWWPARGVTRLHPRHMLAY